jgi:hypothetical protein
MTFELKATLVLGIVLSSTLGDYYSKLYTVDQRLAFGAIALAAYAFGGLIWLDMLTYFKNLALSASLWVLISMGSALVVSQVCFGEHLTTRCWCGIVVGLVAIVLML